MGAEDLFHLGIKGLVHNRAGKILLMQISTAHMKLHGHQVDDQQAYWDLPGGRVEKDATVLQTLQREIAEETGIATITKVQPLGMVLSNIRIPAGDTSYGLILGVYTCSIPDDAAISLSSEHSLFEWTAPAEAAKRLAVKYPPEFCRLVAKL